MQLILKKNRQAATDEARFCQRETQENAGGCWIYVPFAEGGGFLSPIVRV